jgi:hypothetical protein
MDEARKTSIEIAAQQAVDAAANAAAEAIASAGVAARPIHGEPGGIGCHLHSYNVGGPLIRLPPPWDNTYCVTMSITVEIRTEPPD